MAFGNHMNSGTKKGCVYGFDLKILRELKSIRCSMNINKSLLMYIYEFCDRRYPKCIQIIPELYESVNKAAKLELDVMKKMYDRIHEYREIIKNIIDYKKDYRGNYNMDDQFVATLTKFYKGSVSRMKKMRIMIGNVMVSTKRVMRKFAFRGDPNKSVHTFELLHTARIEDLITIWYDFINDFEDAKRRLIKLEIEKYTKIDNYKTVYFEKMDLYKQMKKEIEFKNRINEISRLCINENLNKKLFDIKQNCESYRK